MTPTEEEAFRNVAADNMALGFLVEILLAQHLKKFPARDRSVIVETLRSTAKKTDHFAGVARGNDDLAELFSDVATRMLGSLDGYIARALERIGPAG